MVDVYNNLTQSMVDSPTVSSFQSCLNKVVKARCESADVTWTLSFSRDCEFDLDAYEIDDE